MDAVATAGPSAATKSNPIAIAAVRMSLLGQEPEGYAKGSTTLGGATQKLDIANIKAQTLIITGEEDKVSPPAVCKAMSEQILGAEVRVLKSVGHWHVFEDLGGVC